MNTKKISYAVIILILIALVVIISIIKPKNISTETIKIGGLFGLTGYASFVGEASQDGFLLAIKDSGMDIQYSIENFGSNFVQLASAAEKLINIDEVSVIIGPEWAEFAEVAAPIAEKNRMLFISPWFTTEQKLIESQYFFSAMPSERYEIDLALDHAEKNGVKKIGVIYSRNTWSQAVVDIVLDEIKTHGIESKIITASQDARDYRSEIIKLKDSDIDAIYVVIATDVSMEAFAKQANELGLTVPMYIPFARAGFITSDTKNYKPFFSGILYPVTKEYKRAAEFNEKYQAEYGHKPAAVNAATAYDMTTLVLEAIKNGASNTEEIIDYLMRVKNHNGYSNLITFDNNGRVERSDVELRMITPEGSEVVSEL